MKALFTINKVARTNSSMIAFIKYNKITKRLVVCFSQGAMYSYTNVPRQYANMLFMVNKNGLSVGEVFIALIKDNKDIPYMALGQAELEYKI